jgi:putative NIF3 family GTP cyclohydrolase 1 type 2
MTSTGMSRRRFCQLTAASLPVLSRQLHAQSSITAREVVRRIQKNVGVPWRTPTADEFKVGDPDLPIHGITTSFMTTLDLLERSAAVGNNFVITHEPTFWSANDEVAPLKEDPLYREKLRFIDKNEMVIWRFHDHWHAHRPDGIFTGWNKAMGWDKYVSPGISPFSLEYALPETGLEQIAEEMVTKLKVRSMRLIGDPKMKITRAGIGGHYIGQCMPLLPRVDLLIVFESREWEAAEYVRDAIAAGQRKALIQMPHEGGEEMGMNECARWLQTFIFEVPIKFIPSGDPFWIPA